MDTNEENFIETLESRCSTGNDYEPATTISHRRRVAAERRNAFSRLGASQQIFDVSSENIMAAIGKRVREAARRRKTIILAENEPQLTKLVHTIESGGYGLEALWNDDFHHSAMVAMTGRNEAYYTDYQGKPQEFISLVKYGYLYQGQRYKWQKQRRGTPDLRLPPAKFVTYIQNHDQIANSGRGERVQFMTNPGRLRAMTALMLLAPVTPMLYFRGKSSRRQVRSIILRITSLISPSWW